MNQASPLPQPTAPVDSQTSPEAERLPGRALRSLGWALVLLAVAGLVQLLTPNPWDADTGYHLAVARLVREHGLLRSFPWTPFSWLSDHWADKELLFHLLFVPFADLSYAAAARAVGTIAGGLALVTGYGILRAERVERAELWSLAALAASGSFVERFAMVRPHLLAIGLALAVTWSAARRRWLLCLALGALYPFTYIGWPLAIALALLAEVARLLCRDRPDVRPSLALVAGCALGVVVHPDFPDIARFAWLVHARILVDTAWRARAGFDLGQEFQPFAAGNLLRYVLVPALLTVAALVLSLRRRASVPLAFALAAAALLALTLRTARFIEYLAPFSAVAAGLAVSGAALPRWTPTAVLASSFAFTAAFGAAPVLALRTRGSDIPPPFVRAFRATIPEGAQVFTCEWGLTGELMLALPERRFMVALDPVLFWAKDPERYARWYELPRRGGAGAADAIRRTFGARFVLCTADPRWSPLLTALTADPSVARVIKSPLWFLYDLEPPAPPRAPLAPGTAPARPR